MSYTKSIFHIVFRTKYSQKTITQEHKEHLFKYTLGFMKKENIYLYQINSMPDHIHMLINLPPSISLSDFVKKTKQVMTIYMKRHRDMFPWFEGWGEGYYGCSTSFNLVPSIRRYIKEQEEHHIRKNISLENELTKLMDYSGFSATEIEYYHKIKTLD